MKENSSEESDALWEAYRDMGLMEDHEETQEQCESPQKSEYKQLPMMEKESTPESLRKEPEEEKGQTTLKVCCRVCSTLECFVNLKL